MYVIHASKSAENTLKNFDEIEFISNNILRFFKIKDEVEKKLATGLSTLKSTQSIALQMQISPHFLFNTLNVVNFIIMDTVKCDRNAQKVISLLTLFLNNINQRIRILYGDNYDCSISSENGFTTVM